MSKYEDSLQKMKNKTNFKNNNLKNYQKIKLKLLVIFILGLRMKYLKKTSYNKKLGNKIIIIEIEAN
jgi:hypothetical protein